MLSVLLGRYIYHLSELHKASGNWVEGAFTLLLHAQLLQVYYTGVYSDCNVLSLRYIAWSILNVLLLAWLDL